MDATERQQIYKRLDRIIELLEANSADLWRPIETYTSDDPVDVWATKYDDPSLGCYQRYVAARLKLDGWWDHTGTRPIYPTHWQPLPAPPRQLEPPAQS